MMIVRICYLKLWKLKYDTRNERYKIQSYTNIYVNTQLLT